MTCSILCGPKKFIEKAKWFRKLFGGGIRQCGSLAVAANHALTHHLPLLPATHILASGLAESLSNLGVKLLLPTETHMLWIDPSPLGFDIATLVDRAKGKGLRLGSQRLIVHIQITEQAIADLIELIAELKEEFKEFADASLVDMAQNIRYSQGNYEGMTATTKLKRMGATYATK